MKNNALITALREVVSCEFADIPEHENDIAYAFSDDFTRRMDKLTKAEKSRFWRMTNTIPKRVAVVVITIMLIALTACSIPTVRAAVVEFFKETYENCIHLFTGEDEDGSKRISACYGLTELPDGFTEINRMETDPMYITHYQNSDGDEIILTQSITDQFSIHMDNEHGTISEITVLGMNITIYESDNYLIAVWLQDGYTFDLTVRGNCDMDLLIRMIEAVQLQ